MLSSLVSRILAGDFTQPERVVWDALICSLITAFTYIIWTKWTSSTPRQRDDDSSKTAGPEGGASRHCLVNASEGEASISDNRDWTSEGVLTPNSRRKPHVDDAANRRPVGGAPRRKLDNESYTVGWICAISTEYVAAQAFLDEEDDGPEDVSINDENHYILGRAGKHNIVIAVLPDGEYGTACAASVAKDMLHSFPNIRIGLMVGIGGGAPSPKHDIRLGDVVVSVPRDGDSGVFQYDFGKTLQGRSFHTTGFLNQPPRVLRNAVNGLKTAYELKGHRYEEKISDILRKIPRLRQKYQRPDPSSDRLYQTAVTHPENIKTSCEASCGSDLTKLIPRRQRGKDEDNPAIHYGLIASANSLIKDAVIRDKLSTEKGVLCFEMEAAGLMNQFPCLVIRGICDYSDTHKNKEWQGYAAMAAAAYAKDLLCRITPNNVEAEKKISAILSDIQSTLQGQVQQQDTRYQDDKNERCRKALHVTDPRLDKQRIEETKGGLLKDSYLWVFDHADFKQFRDDSQCRMLWIKGDPGKGKTMLLCGIVHELEKESNNLPCYFFCQATEGQLNNATSVLRGLIYMLLIRQQSLIRYVRAEYDLVGEKLFQGINVWVSLVKIFTNMLTDPTLTDAILIVDALDECTTGRRELLDFIIQSTIIPSSSVKWIVSSRNWPEIENQLVCAQKVRLHLELNEDSVSKAVEMYIDYQVGQLARDKKYDEDTRTAVQRHLISSANGTFLWVALACQQLAKVARRHTLSKLKAFPPGLDLLYDRMIGQIYDSEDADRCKEVLAIASVVYRPITLEELKVLIKSPNDLQQGDLEEIIASCGSFLTLRKGFMYFVHQSAKDFLLEKASDQIIPTGIAQQHYALFLKSLEALSGTLRRDIYNLGTPGSSIDEVSPPDLDPLASIRYSCVFWVNHFDESESADSAGRDFKTQNTIRDFIQTKYLYWLESLSLLRSMSEGVIGVQKLENIVRSTNAQHVELLRDARRFLLSHKRAIELAPLQVYASALLFSPKRSIVRELYKKEEPSWVILKPIMESDWNACLQTLEGHSNSVASVAFSPDGQRLASGSDDRKVKVWDAATGACVQTLEGHSEGVTSVVFSPDGHWLASGSYDSKVKVWDAATGACVQTLEGHSSSVTSVGFSPDSQRLASGSWDGKVKVWDAATGTCMQALEGHSESVRSVVFSPDGERLASGSWDGKVKVWDAATGAYMQTLEGHSFRVTSVVFSPDSQWLASGSHDGKVKVWDAATGACVQTLEGHSFSVTSVMFSPDSQRLASGSDDSKVKVWDAATGTCMQTLEGHSNSVRSVVFSPDGQRLASGSYDNRVKVWDAAIGACVQTLEGHEGHSNWVRLVVFSPDGQRLASGSDDGKVKVWDAATGACMQTLEGHNEGVTSVVFSPDSQRLASGSHDGKVKVWDAATGACVQTLEGHSESVTSVVFSPDGERLASGSEDEKVKVWDAAVGACVQTLEGHEAYNFSERLVVFSPDSQRLALGSHDGKVKVWDAATGACVQTLEGHSEGVTSVLFSPDGQRLASGSQDGKVKVWDAATGACVQTLGGHSFSVTSVRFSLDGQRLVSGSYDGKVKVWDATKGACVQTLDIGGQPVYLSLNPMNDSLLRSNIGTFDLSSRRVSPSGYGIGPGGIWIMKDGYNILWIPPDYRANASAVAETTVALGCHSGRLLLMKFSEDMHG